MTAIAIAGVSYGLASRDERDILDEFVLVAAATLLIIGVPAAFMWFNAARVLLGNASAAWRVQKHLTVVTSGMVAVGLMALLFTAQLTALGFLAVAFGAVVVCGLLMKRVLDRDQVARPALNWHDRQAARAAARRR